MQWWCSASGLPWTWTWRAYPGVWAIILVLGVTYWKLTESNLNNSTRTTVSVARRAMGWIGVALIWIALDWPLGPLAAGYLASAHALQFMVLALAAPPLMLASLAPHVAARANDLQSRSNRIFNGRIFKLLTAPVVAGVMFNVVAGTTHVPGVVDNLMRSQSGAFAIDMAWLTAGLIFWWPILVDVPLRPHFPPLLKILYLFLGTLVHTVIAIIMLMAEFPMYGIYELAPPSGWFTPLTDLGIAGGIMELVGAGIIFGMITGLFFRWVSSEAAHDL